MPEINEENMECRFKDHFKDFDKFVTRFDDLYKITIEASLNIKELQSMTNRMASNTDNLVHLATIAEQLRVIKEDLIEPATNKYKTSNSTVNLLMLFCSIMVLVLGGLLLVQYTKSSDREISFDALKGQMSITKDSEGRNQGQLKTNTNVLEEMKVQNAAQEMRLKALEAIKENK